MKVWMMNGLYEFTMKILPGDAGMPDGLTGAYVVCYAGAPDYQAALKNGVVAITQMGYRFDDIQNGVREVSLDSWGAYVEEVWPEYLDQMPSAVELPEVVEEGQVFFGPFVGFSE